MEFLHGKFQFLTQFQFKTGNVTETKKNLVVHKKFVVSMDELWEELSNQINDQLPEN